MSIVGLLPGDMEGDEEKVVGVRKGGGEGVLLWI